MKCFDQLLYRLSAVPSRRHSLEIGSPHADHPFGPVFVLIAYPFKDDNDLKTSAKQKRRAVSRAITGYRLTNVEDKNWRVGMCNESPPFVGGREKIQ